MTLHLREPVSLDLFGYCREDFEAGVNAVDTIAPRTGKERPQHDPDHGR